MLFVQVLDTLFLVVDTYSRGGYGFSTITYGVAGSIARITLNRVDVRNAQDKSLYELNHA